MSESSFLSGRATIVTGGSRGIGFATARALRIAGADVLISGRSREALDRATDQIRRDTDEESPGRISSFVADVGDVNQAQKLVDEASEQFGGVDILINNAGVGRFAPLEELTVEAWREMMDTNLSGAFYCVRAVIPIMRLRGGGWIINVSSLAGAHPFASGGGYCASKAGLNALTESLMQEVRRDGIRVTCVLPGSVNTAFGGGGPSPEADWKLAAEDVARVVLDQLRHPVRSLPSRIELRPSIPNK